MWNPRPHYRAHLGLYRGSEPTSMYSVFLLLSSVISNCLIYYLLLFKSQAGWKGGIAPKYQWWKLADKVTQLAITRLFQSARQFIFSVNVSFHNSSLTHKLYLSRIFQGLKWSPSSAMLNDLWNNLIMMSCWQTDLSQEWSHVMDMSTALVTGEKTVGVRDEG